MGRLLCVNEAGGRIEQVAQAGNGAWSLLGVFLFFKDLKVHIRDRWRVKRSRVVFLVVG